ncbi:hypothetical protein J6590_041948 [Homalodisca vitripennis]|nr:hypothetical protein J6590_041948 [Homalodisca vitripennis]
MSGSVNITLKEVNIIGSQAADSDIGFAEIDGKYVLCWSRPPNAKRQAATNTSIQRFNCYCFEFAMKTPTRLLIAP